MLTHSVSFVLGLGLGVVAASALLVGLALAAFSRPRTPGTWADVAHPAPRARQAAFPPRLAVRGRLTPLGVLLYVLAALLLTLGAAWVTRAAYAQPACTHYTEPASALTVQSWLPSAQPGQVLCLREGTYTASGQMLTIASGQGGTEAAPLWIRAEQEGRVLIDGQFGQRPLDCLGHDVVFWGLNVKDGPDSVLVLRGTRCQAKRLVAWSSAASWGIDNVVDLGGTHNLLEDVSAWGYARKVIAAGARGGVSHNVLRRVFAELNGFVPSGGADPGNPSHPLEIGYDQDHVTVENAIVRRHILTSATDPQAPLVLFSSRQSWIGGVLAYLEPGDHMDTTLLGHVYPEGGSHEGSGHVNAGNTLTQSVFLVPPAFPSVKGFVIQGGSGSSGNVADTLVGVDPQRGSGCSGDGWECRHLNVGTTLSEALGAGTTLWTALPGVCRQIVGQHVSAVPLWPWPMNARTFLAMAQAGRKPVDLTRTMERVFGPIPDACRSDRVPPHPEPVPPGATLACQGDLLAGGKIALTCTPQGERR